MSLNDRADTHSRDWLESCRVYRSTDLEWWLMGAWAGILLWVVVLL